MPLLQFYCRYFGDFQPNSLICFVCNNVFSENAKPDEALSHLYFDHRVVIENPENIGDFKSYMDHYRLLMKGGDLLQISRPFILNQDDPEAIQKVFIIGDFLPRDKELRIKLYEEKLKDAEEHQKLVDHSPEVAERHCFVCHVNARTTRLMFLDHLRSHGFVFGRAEKMVYLDHFIDALVKRFKIKRCLYCDSVFPTQKLLMLHMEESGHKKIHPANKFFDQFYMVNYLEYGKKWMDYTKKKEDLDSVNDDDETVEEKADDWNDWSGEEEDEERTVCLLCDQKCLSWQGALLHLLAVHDFSFQLEVLGRPFYEQVKIVNYIRSRVRNFLCINCHSKFKSSKQLTEHMDENNHAHVPGESKWDHPEYLFPIMEGDVFLLHLVDAEEERERERVDIDGTRVVRDNGDTGYGSSSLSPSSSPDVHGRISIESNESGSGSAE